MKYKYRGTIEDLQKIIFKAGYWILDAKLLPHKSPRAYKIETSVGKLLFGLRAQEKLSFKAKLT